MNSILFNDKKIFPSKIICVGKNYLEHAKEMGDSRPPEEPVIFLKPNSALVQGAETVNVPRTLGVLHHEVELCFLIGEGGRDLSEGAARRGIAAATVGIDFTLREKQKKLKDSGLPWEISKGFDSSAVFGRFENVENLKDISNLGISLKVNGKLRQQSNTGHMIFGPARIVSYVSQFMTIEPGDLFMCGTPSGVGAVAEGDIIEAFLEGIPDLRFKVTRDL